jgi:hypothetical protein
MNDTEHKPLPGIFEEISQDLNRIRHWIPSVIYPHESRAVPNSNCVITGDGLGMAYFNAVTPGPRSWIKVVRLVDPKIKAFFALYGTKDGDTIPGDKLCKIIEAFVFEEVAKFEGK